MGKKEQDIAAFEALRTRMQENGYRERSTVISVFKANVLAIVTAGPFALLAVVCYTLMWGSRLSAFLPPEQALLVLLLFLLSLPVHELLHGIGWCAAGRTGFQNIRFGIMWSSLTPYCHCSGPLSAGQYLFGLLLPFFVLGLGLSAAAIAAGNGILLWLGVFSLLGAGGDTTICCYLLKYRKALIADHPTECGFAAFEKD